MRKKEETCTERKREGLVVLVYCRLLWSERTREGEEEEEGRLEGQGRESQDGGERGKSGTRRKARERGEDRTILRPEKELEREQGK